jgi:hypothetical protein
LIRDRELNSNGVFLGWVDVFFGGLETEECRFKYEIISGSLLGGVYFGIFISVPLIYVTFVFVASLLRFFARLVQRPGY